MTSKYLTGTYNAGYTLTAAYTGVTLGPIGSIAGIGLVGNASPDTAVNLGRITATVTAGTGISLQAGGTVANGSTSNITAFVTGGTGTVGSTGTNANGGAGGSGGAGISL